MIKEIKTKRSKKRVGYPGCGTIMCAGGCDYMTYGRLDRLVYCMDCGKKEMKLRC